MTGTPRDPFSFDDWLAWVEDPSKHLGEADRGFVAALVRQRVASLLSRVETLEGALSAIEFNAESWHAGEDGKARALRVIAGWARRPETVPEDVAGYARAGSPRGEEGDVPKPRRDCGANGLDAEQSSSPDGAPPLGAEDLRVDTYSNIAISTVRITHLPTGLTATSGEYRSQLRNKEQALRELAAKVAAVADGAPEETRP